jgi:adenylosuccinate lyase
VQDDRKQRVNRGKIWAGKVEVILPYSFDTFLSPFTWRYGSEAMRQIWSEVHKRRMWRRIWAALAEAQAEIGLIKPEQAADLRAHINAIDVEAALAAERTLRHDLMAEVHVFASFCAVGGGIIHLGATSTDIEDNADALRLRDSLDLILHSLRALLNQLANQIDAWADRPAMAFTHLQPAEPTTIGYRLALYGQDLIGDYHELTRVRNNVRGKGIKGAVGTSASYQQLLQGRDITPAEFEARVMRKLDLVPFMVAGQTYPRKQDWLVASALASLASSLYKFAFDLRILQSPSIGEWAESFEAGQVGSSAMPFKRNPINSEKVDSLGRLVAHLIGVTWDNASHSLLERTLDDSANRREVLPVLFLAVDEMLIVATRLIGGLIVDEEATNRTLERYGTFAATERLLMELVKAGADRQKMHEILRDHSMAAWQSLRSGGPNPLIDDLSADPSITAYLPAREVRALLDASDYTGDATERALALAAEIRMEVRKYSRAVWPDFTWDYIIQVCGAVRKQLTPLIDEEKLEIARESEKYPGAREDAKRRVEHLMDTIDLHEGLLATVPRLRANPAIDKMVPGMSVNCLIWRPRDGWTVWLTYRPHEKKYVIWMHGETVLNEKRVDLDDVTATVWAYISEVRGKDTNDDATSAIERS